MRTLLGRMIARANATPKYLICDEDSIFWCESFKRWCRRKQIGPRYGAVGQHGSIAVIERFIRTMKDEGTRRILVPQRRMDFRRKLTYFFAWHNACRPHAALEGRTPNERYFRLRPANRRPRLEPRARWPRSSPWRISRRPRRWSRRSSTSTIMSGCTRHCNFCGWWTIIVKTRQRCWPSAAGN